MWWAEYGSTMAAVDDRDPAGFTVVRHGFDRGQVRQRVAELRTALESAETGRAEAAEEAAELRGELQIARREIAALAERLDTQGDEESAGRLLSVAKSQAAEVNARAKVAAEQSWAAAEQASAALRDRYRTLLSALDEQHAEVTRTHKSVMASAKAQVQQMTEEAERRREAIEKEAEADRVRIDREFSESMKTKREALRQELETARAECDREVTARLAAADAEAKRRVDAVTDQVRHLAKVRDQLSERLRETKELLELSASLLEPVEGEATADKPEPPKTVPPQREAKRQPAKR